MEDPNLQPTDKVLLVNDRSVNVFRKKGHSSLYLCTEDTFGIVFRDPVKVLKSFTNPQRSNITIVSSDKLP